MKILVIFDQLMDQQRANKILEKLNHVSLEGKLKLSFFSSINCTDFDMYEIVFCIGQDVSVLAKMKNLKLVISNNAGVENILPFIKERNNIKLVRLLNPIAVNRMASYTLACVLDFEKNMAHWRENQKNKIWERTPSLFRENLTIGIMGYGEIGKVICEKLLKNDYKIKVFSKTEKSLSFGHYTENNINSFLNGVDILVSCLPTTHKTIGILNYFNFKKLNTKAAIVNIGRGTHLVEDDLLKAINDGIISTAYLDVFSSEPLQRDHVFWHHPKIQVTPHIAGVFSAEDNIPLVIQVCIDFLEQRPLENLICSIEGY